MKRLAVGYLGLLSVLLSTGQTLADPYGVIGLNFTGRGPGGTPEMLHVEFGESASGVAGVNDNDVWNDILAYGDSGMRGTFGPMRVIGSQGESAVLTFSSRGTWSNVSTGTRIMPFEDPSGDMKDGYIEGVLGDFPLTVNVSGLEDDFPAYDVYVYVGDAAAGRSGSVTLNDSPTVAFTSKIYDGVFVEATGGNAADYVVFHDVIGDSFTLTGGGIDYANRTGIHGLEIVGVPPPDTQTVDLLALVDLDRDVVAGDWEMVNNELFFAGAAARLSFPYHPPAEYDYTVEYTLTHGSDPWDNFAQLASHGNVPFTWSTNAGTGHFSRLEDINGHAVIGNPTLTAFEFVDGGRYTSTVRVRNDRVITEINGQTLVEYFTDYSDLSRNNSWAMPDQLNLGLGGYGGTTTIHSATVSFLPPPTAEFGSIGPNVFTGFEEAENGATSFVRSAESTELGWTMIGSGAIAAVVEDLVDPNDPANLHQFHLNNGWGNMAITTELIDLREFADVQVSLDLRFWDTSSGFESENGINVSIFTSTDGLTFESIPWLSLMGADAVLANQGAQHGAFTNYITPPGLIPDDAATMKVRLILNNNSLSEHIMLDNLRITAGAFTPNAVFWDEQGEGNWRDLDPQTELSRWVDHLGNSGPILPTQDTPVVVRTDTVTVAADREAASLVIESGQVLISEHATLTLSDTLEVQSGASLTFAIGDTSAGRVAAGGDVEMDLESELHFQIDGASPFKAGTYTLITAEEGLFGQFGTSTGLGRYVSTGLDFDGLSYGNFELRLRIDRDLHPGDANLSGKTDLTDFNVWNAHKFATGTTWTTGDFNGDGNTDLSDFNIWNAHKFTIATGGAAPAPTQVPEPGSLMLLIVAAAVACIYRLRHRSA